MMTLIEGIFYWNSAKCEASFVILCYYLKFVQSCVDAAHSSIHTDAVARLLSRRAPVQCRMCGFHGDTRSQLLDHLASASHSARLMKLRLRRLRCAPCRLVGSCDDILRHVQCDPHANNMAAKPLVITAARRRRCASTSTILNWPYIFCCCCYY